MKQKKKSTCISCGGTGQINFFQGASRFVLTVTECPECSGTGYVEESPDKEHRRDAPSISDKKKD